MSVCSTEASQLLILSVFRAVDLANSDQVRHTMKRCAVCKEIKAEEEFNWRWKAQGRRWGTCKKCQQQQKNHYYATHREEYNSRKRIRTRIIRNSARQYVLDYLSAHPCVECGESDPMVLEFDHIHGRKSKAVSVMVSEGRTFEAIQAEIDKCQVLCANCHRRKTMKEMGWFKSKR